MNQIQLNKIEWSNSDTYILPRRRSDVRLEELDNEGLLHDPMSKSLCELNSTALHTWKNMNVARTTANLARLQMEAFEVDFDTALDDVEQLAAKFAEAGLLESGVSS